MDWSNLIYKGNVIPNYEVSTHGNIRRKETGKLLKERTNNARYIFISVMMDKKGYNISAHRAVAETFIKNPENLKQVNHKDRNRSNNYLENLEWISPRDNILYSFKMGRKQHTRVVNQYDLEGNFIQRFESMKEACEFLGKKISSHIAHCANGRSPTAYGYKWKYEQEKLENEPKNIPFKEFGYYHIYNDGRIYSTRTKRFMKTVLGPNSYKELGLRMNNKYVHYTVHKLVAKFFVPTENPEKKFVNHKDGNKQNNHYKNLEWVTCSENMIHALETGLLKTRKPISQFFLSGEFIRTYNSMSEASLAMGGKRSSGNVNKVCQGRQKTAYGFLWKYASE